MSLKMAITILLAPDFFFLLPLLMKVDSKTFETAVTDIDFAMNDKCAAGRGRFLEVMAGALEEKVENMGRLSLKSKNRI